ncbi:MAG: SDR family oxidoreductase, partial [Anaerolineales bacterium]
PGPVQTGYISRDFEDKLLPTIPLQRIGQPEEIADVILFLASEPARWLTGQVIKVSGGHAL